MDDKWLSKAEKISKISDNLPMEGNFLQLAYMLHTRMWLVSCFSVCTKLIALLTINCNIFSVSNEMLFKCQGSTKKVSLIKLVLTLQHGSLRDYTFVPHF